MTGPCVMRLSSYTRFVEMCDNTLVVSLLTQSVFRVSNSMARLLQSNRNSLETESFDDKSLLKALLSSLAIVPYGFDEVTWMKEQHVEARKQREVLSITIAPTMSCNMSCHYCFQEHHPRKLDSGNYDFIEDYIREQLPGYQRLHVQWFGGEPLLDLPAIEGLSRRLTDLANRIDANFSAELITNGTLLSRQTAERLAALGICEVQITLEGPRETHDRIRRNKSGNGSFDDILKNARSASLHMNVAARIHLAPYTVDKIHALLEMLHNEKMQQVFKQLYFAPLFDYRPHEGAKRFESDDKRFFTSVAFAEAQSPLIAYAKKLGFNTNDPLDSSYGLCFAMQDGSLVLDQEGQTYKCYLDAGNSEYSLGNVADAPLPPSKWDKYDFLSDSECSQCDFLPVCLGGCPKQRMQNSPKETVCTPLKYNFDERMRAEYL